MTFEKEMKIIKKTKDITITKHIFPQMTFCSFIEVETADLCFSIELSCMAFEIIRDKKSLGSDDLKDIPNKAIIEIIQTRLPMYQEKFEQGLKEDNPKLATMYCQKRDSAKQFYKLFNNEKFSKMAMYNYALDVYISVEDHYAYEVLEFPLSYFRQYLSDEINAKLKDELKKHITNSKIEVYRGFNYKSRKDGISYTLSYDVAQFFASRWTNEEEEGYINKYEVHIDDILAYIGGGEEEIITTKARLIESNI